MKILNPQVQRDLEAGKGLWLDLGAGARPRAGHYGVDHHEMAGIDIVADLEKPLSALPDNSVSRLYSHHVLEHVHDFLGLLAEIHRVTRPDAEIEIVVPHFSNPYHYSDPTHVRTFGLYSFYYFVDQADQPRRKVPSFYLPERFKVEQVQIKLLRGNIVGQLLCWPIRRLINLSRGCQDWYERRLCGMLPAESIRYVLRPIKGAVQATTRAA